MHAATIFTTLALASSAAAIPAPASLKRRGDFPSFRLSGSRTYGNSCIPGYCVVVDYGNLVVESDCGGKDCDAPSAGGFDKTGSMCDKEIEFCDRKVTLVSRGDGDCRKISDMDAEGDHGKPYATISENGNDVGVCYVNLKETGTQPCGMAAGTTYTALIDCRFN
ncbi:hypothetical protein F66182_10161 [Fusarium sp. NRRL 66182]|nr:hypothetical protein F66182_10161 [Fusarium sp. NRRL 66182]